MNTRTIIVATDGTNCSRAAVEWAAREAQRRQIPLRIVHSYEWDWAESRYSIGSEYVDIARKLAEGVVNTAASRARELAPGIDIVTETLVGHTIPRLLEVSRDAELLVVGSRGRGGFTGLLLGSVSEHLATHAPCPVVVVRGVTSADAPAPIVAGIDESPAADQVLENAFTAADERGAPLLIVHAYAPAVPLWVSGVAAIAIDSTQQDNEERVRLDGRLAPWIAKFPGVAVSILLTHDNAASALVSASRRGRLVVIGSRGHGRVAGALIGSTGLQLLHHAGCPVLVVR